jgi:hypothetical protein
MNLIGKRVFKRELKQISDILEDADGLRVIGFAEELRQRGEEPDPHELREEQFRDLVIDLHKLDRGTFRTSKLPLVAHAISREMTLPAIIYSIRSQL